jgi:exopolyphosphatase/guanosine-5'-triphosphate,3'-diphosphate pyrophosphatase
VLALFLTASTVLCPQGTQQDSQATAFLHQIVRRVAFDIGSGQIKMQISDVDVTVNKIANVLFTDTAYVALREDLAKSLDGRFSIEIQNKTIDAISQLIRKALSYHPDAYHAVATESFRLAKNGLEFSKKIEEQTQLAVTIVTQEEEGILGFISAIYEANADPEKAISWDFGGGSFQITTQCNGRYVVYNGRLGKVPLKEALLKIQGKEDFFSPNPISQSEAEQAIEYIKGNISYIPFEIRNKLQNPDLSVLGIGIHPLWGMPNNSSYDKTRIWNEIESRLNLDDEMICIKDSISRERQQAAAYVVSNLILTYGIMDDLNIHRVNYVGTPGANAIGILLSPNYWNTKIGSPK